MSAADLPRSRYGPEMAKLSRSVTDELTRTLDCTATLRRAVDDLLTEVGLVVACGWDTQTVGESDGQLLSRHVFGEPDHEGWLTAQVVTVAGYVLDLADPDVIDNADEISGDLLELAERLRPDGDTVLAVDLINWFAPFDSVELSSASLELIDHTLVGAWDRMAYILGRHLRLVRPLEMSAPEVEHPIEWWHARGWTELGNQIITRSCRRL
jgi:hypothetical protein